MSALARARADRAALHSSAVAAVVRWAWDPGDDPWTDWDPLAAELGGFGEPHLAPCPPVAPPIRWTKYGFDRDGRCRIAQVYLVDEPVLERLYEYDGPLRIGTAYRKVVDHWELEQLTRREYVDERLVREDRLVGPAVSVTEFSYEANLVIQRHTISPMHPAGRVEVVIRDEAGEAIELRVDDESIWARRRPIRATTSDAVAVLRHAIANRLNTVDLDDSTVILLRFTGSGYWSDAAWPSLSLTRAVGSKGPTTDIRTRWDWTTWPQPQIDVELDESALVILDALDGTEPVERVAPTMRKVAAELMDDASIPAVIVATNMDLGVLAESIDQLDALVQHRLNQWGFV